MRQLPDHGCRSSSVSSQKFPEKYGVDEQIFDVPAKLGQRGRRTVDVTPIPWTYETCKDLEACCRCRNLATLGCGPDHLSQMTRCPDVSSNNAIITAMGSSLRCQGGTWRARLRVETARCYS